MLLWSVLLTSLTGILGVAPLKVVRAQLGAVPFWLLGVGLSLLFWSTKLPALGVAILVLTILVAAQTQAEEMGFGLYRSTFIGLVAAVLSVAGLTIGLVSKLGPEWMTLMKEKIGTQLATLGAEFRTSFGSKPDC